MKNIETSLKIQEQINFLKKKVSNADWKNVIQDCQTAITERYKFWKVKQDSSTKRAMIQDIERDIRILKNILKLNKLGDFEQKELSRMKKKYIA